MRTSTPVLHPPCSRALRGVKINLVVVWICVRAADPPLNTTVRSAAPAAGWAAAEEPSEEKQNPVSNKGFTVLAENNNNKKKAKPLDHFQLVDIQRTLNHGISHV